MNNLDSYAAKSNQYNNVSPIHYSVYIRPNIINPVLPCWYMRNRMNSSGREIYVFSGIRGQILPALQLIYVRIAPVQNSAGCLIICYNSKLLSGFPWPTIF
jgi:hypothetical protein